MNSTHLTKHIWYKISFHISALLGCHHQGIFVLTQAVPNFGFVHCHSRGSQQPEYICMNVLTHGRGSTIMTNGSRTVSVSWGPGKLGIVKIFWRSHELVPGIYEPSPGHCHIICWQITSDISVLCSACYCAVCVLGKGWSLLLPEVATVLSNGNMFVVLRTSSYVAVLLGSQWVILDWMLWKQRWFNPLKHQ